jgi:hypothetical protein
MIVVTQRTWVVGSGSASSPVIPEGGLMFISDESVVEK